MTSKSHTKESDLYEPVKKSLAKRFRKMGESYFEVTSEGRLSEKLKKKLDDAALYMLSVERFVPDIIGYVLTGKTSYGETSELVVAEVKGKRIRIKDILQARGYGVVFDANYSILVSSHTISEEVRRFCEKRHTLAAFRSYERVAIGQFDPTGNQFVDKSWYPAPPFREW